MVKTQIQVPDELYRQVKQLAARREWSLAETFRRAAELLLEVHPAGDATRSVDWVPPVSPRAGWRGLSATQLRDLAIAEQEERERRP